MGAERVETQDMGVLFIAYSFLVTEPVPLQFRASWKAVSEAYRVNIEKDLKAMPSDVASLCMYSLGVSRDASGRLVIPDERVQNEDAETLFYETIGASTDFVTVDWTSNTFWRATGDSREAVAGRSYGGYGSFVGEVEAAFGRARQGFYMPPATDCAPEMGIVSTERCLQCLRTLEAVRSKWVSDVWTPGPGRPFKTEEGLAAPVLDSEEDLREDSWFFREFFTAMSLAANGSGIVIIS